MKILLSNDDGVDAKGLNTLAAHVRDIAEVDVVAPDRNRSGASNSLTLTVPLRAKYLSTHVVSVEGTPTDCVNLAITGLLDYKPDLVLSGINDGANLGDDVWYSGTVAAAMEGRFLGFPAIAVSLVGDQNFDTAAMVAKQLVNQIVKDPLPASTILNVNVPDVPFEQLEGFEVTRLGTRHKTAPVIQQKDPRGHTIYWVGPPGAEQDAGPGTDFHAVNNNYVSITPIRVDLTHYKAFDQLSLWVNGLSK